MIKGLPVELYSLRRAAMIYLGLGRHFGSLRSSNGKGHLLGHVKDIGRSIDDPNTRFYQTSKRLEYHTDSADIVGLLCLQPARTGGESFIVSSVTVYNEICKRRPDLIAALFEPYPTDRRGEVPQCMLPWFEIPIFNWYQNKLSAIYIRHYIEEAQRHRHLLRLWIAPEGGRPLLEVYAPRYGTVKAGDRGGIIVPGSRLTVSLTAE